MKLHHLSLFKETGGHCHEIYIKSIKTPFQPEWCVAGIEQTITLTGALLGMINTVSTDDGSLVEIVDKNFEKLTLKVNLKPGSRTITLTTACGTHDIAMFARELTYTSDAEQSINIDWQAGGSPELILRDNAMLADSNVGGTAAGVMDNLGANYLLAPAEHDFEVFWNIFRTDPKGKLPDASHAYSMDLGVCGNNVDHLDKTNSLDAKQQMIDCRAIANSRYWKLTKYHWLVSTDLGGEGVNIGTSGFFWIFPQDKLFMSRTNGILKIEVVKNIGAFNEWRQTFWEFSDTTYDGPVYWNSVFNIGQTGTSAGFIDIKSWYAPKIGVTP